MPICCMCREDKPEAAFAFRNIATGQLQSHCRECHAAYRRQHYLDNTPTYIENERVRVRAHRERNRELLRQYLLGHPCVDCGEADPVVLDFDHRDPSLKRIDVPQLAAHQTWASVLQEIEKCDVRCASCHRRRTAEQFGWRRATLPSTATFIPPIRQLPAVEQLTLEIRQCRSCHVVQSIHEFAIKNKKTGQRSWKCRSCQRAYARAHYQANRPTYLGKSGRRNRAERERFASFFIQYFSAHPCVDCGATDARILDFDHRDPATKTETINVLARRGDWDAVLAEIAKCDVRCANCHRRRTARQFGYYRARISEAGFAA